MTAKGTPFECRLHGGAITYGCPGCYEAAEDTYDAALVRDRLRWWRLPNLCQRLGGHFWRRLDAGVHRCWICKTLKFSNATEAQFKKWMLS